MTPPARARARTRTAHPLPSPQSIVLLLLAPPQMLDDNVPLGKLNRGMAVLDVVRSLAEGRQQDNGAAAAALSDDEVFKANALGWCIEFLQVRGRECVQSKRCGLRWRTCGGEGAPASVACDGALPLPLCSRPRSDARFP